MGKTLLAVAAAAVMVAAPALAHHSSAMFDEQKLVVLKGTVRSFSYMNPHSWISLEARPDGEAASARWDVEATSPQSLARIGIQGTTLKPGDKVTVAVRPLRDGRHGGSLVFVVTTDGKAYGASPAAVGLKIEDLKPL